MSHYQHLLVAVDLLSENDPAIIKAATLAKAFGARLSFLHVIEPVPAYAEVTPLNIEEELVSHAKTLLADLGARFGVTVADQHVRIGPPKHEIVDAAKEFNVDLLVLGSHGRHGLSLLLGSTANAVVHGAHCDVITIRKS